jgi:hypothetical protein
MNQFNTDEVRALLFLVDRQIGTAHTRIATYTSRGSLRRQYAIDKWTADLARYEAIAGKLRSQLPAKLPGL